MTDTEQPICNTPAPVGTVGGFHYGNEYRGCNGLYRATEEMTSDHRQVFVCDVCGTKGARRVEPDK